jgi:hypothetical protein
MYLPVYMIHQPMGNFCDEHRHAIKPTIIQECNKHIEYADIGNRMVSSYSIPYWRYK